MMRPDFIDLIKDDMFKEELKPMIKWLDYNLYLYESDIEDSDDEALSTGAFNGCFQRALFSWK